MPRWENKFDKINKKEISIQLLGKLSIVPTEGMEHRDFVSGSWRAGFHQYFPIGNEEDSPYSRSKFVEYDLSHQWSAAYSFVLAGQTNTKGAHLLQHSDVRLPNCRVDRYKPLSFDSTCHLASVTRPFSDCSCL